MLKRMLCLFVLLLSGMPTAAQDNDEVIRLNLHNGTEPSPSLRYQLLPDVPDRIPGNAVVPYYRSFSPEWYSWRNRPKVQQKIEDALRAAPGTLLKTDLGWVKTLGQLEDLDRGARCAYCDWQLTDRMRKEGITLLLPDMQSFRELSRLLALRTRLHVAGQEYDKAIYSSQTGFALARDISEAPLLICVLVGVACAQQQLEQVEGLMQAPGATNLYWALTDLPRPFIDIRKAVGGEKLLLEAEMPHLMDVEKRRFNQDDVAALAGEFANLVRRNESSPSLSTGESLGLLLMAVEAYPAAKKRLEEEGWKSKDLDAMPAVQVVAIDARRQFLKLRDEANRWAVLPYPQAVAGLLENQKNLRNFGNENRIARPLFDLIGPSLRVLNMVWRVERRIAALRVIEAIRLYAASHEGRLPATLADIHVVPVPEDPCTGKTFDYKPNGNHFRLSGPAPAGDYLTLTFDVTFTH